MDGNGISKSKVQPMTRYWELDIYWIRMQIKVETKHFKLNHMVWNKGLQIKFRQWGLLLECKFSGKLTENWETNTKSQCWHSSNNSTERISHGNSRTGVGWRSYQGCLTITCFEPEVLISRGRTECVGISNTGLAIDGAKAKAGRWETALF